MPGRDRPSRSHGQHQKDYNISVINDEASRTSFKMLKRLKPFQRIAVAAIVGLGLSLMTGCIIEEPSRVAYAPAPAVTAAPPAPSSGLQALYQQAQQGDPVAQFTLGSCYANGRGVFRNYAVAV